MSQKNKILKDPSGILQITPESLESMLMNRSNDIVRLFGDLRSLLSMRCIFDNSDEVTDYLSALQDRAADRLSSAQDRFIGHFGRCKLAPGFAGSGRY